MKFLRAGPIDDGEAMVRLAFAEALRAAGRDVDAVTAIRDAHERLRARAALISDETLRERFLAGVPENARTVALARESVL